MTQALKRAIEAGRVELAGCLVHAGARRWRCAACGVKHGSADPGSAAPAGTTRGG